MKEKIVVKEALGGFVPVLMRYRLDQDEWITTFSSSPIRRTWEVAALDARLWAQKENLNLDLET